MTATFSRLSLLIQVASQAEESDRLALRLGAALDLRRARMIFHEAVHYWQQLSQGFLLRLADEEWQRMKNFERSGKVLAMGPIGQEFAHRYADIGFSARDLHECLARFWEVAAFTPRAIIDEELRTQRVEAHSDFREADRRVRAQLGLPAGASGAYDFHVAMHMIGGEYASPFLSTCQDFLDVAVFVFPWLAHFALQARAPVPMFSRFMDAVGEGVADAARANLGRSDVPIDEQFSHTMNHVAHLAFLVCLQVAAESGDRLPLGTSVYRQSALASNPAYKHVFERRVIPTGLALASSEAIATSSQAVPRSGSREEARLVLAHEMLQGFLATPGLTTSQIPIYMSGLAPPAIRYLSGDILPLQEECRRQAKEALDNLRRFDLARALIPQLMRPGLISEDREIIDGCIDAQDRWESFAQVERGGRPSR
jgi:hypothetical protein